MNIFMRHLLRVINKLCKGGKSMEDQDKPDKPRKLRGPSDWAKEEKKSEKIGKPVPLKQLDDAKFDKDGNLNVKLTVDDSALVVRADGTVDLVSHDLENADNGYVGDIEDLNKTFSLVLALASALENQDLYNRIFHNLNMTLMRKWDNMPDNIKKQIVEKRNQLDENRDDKEDEEKHNRVDEFRKRMSKYKDSFLDSAEEEKKKLRKDMKDEEDFHKKYGRDFGASDAKWESMMEDQSDSLDELNKMETRPSGKMKKKKKQPALNYLKGVNWHPYDKTLKAHFKEWHADESPPEEED